MIGRTAAKTGIKMFWLTSEPVSQVVSQLHQSFTNCQQINHRTTGKYRFSLLSPANMPSWGRHKIGSTTVNVALFHFDTLRNHWYILGDIFIFIYIQWYPTKRHSVQSSEGPVWHLKKGLDFFLISSTSSKVLGRGKPTVSGSIRAQAAPNTPNPPKRQRGTSSGIWPEY